jgi:multidrug resistance efflux pump
MTNQNPGVPAQNSKKKLLFPLLIVAVLGVICYFVVQSYLYVGTDDAYVEAHSLMLAPRIGGVINKV